MEKNKVMDTESNGKFVGSGPWGKSFVYCQDWLSLEKIKLSKLWDKEGGREMQVGRDMGIYVYI